MCFLVALVIAFSGLGPAQAQPNSSPPSVLIVGSEQDYPPFATGMNDAEAGGFTVDLWKAVAAEAGLDYTIRVRPFHQILQEFKDGKINVLINLATSDERREFADFSVPHVIVHGAIFVRRAEDGIQSEDDLSGKSIIVLNADLAYDYALSRGWRKQLVLVETVADGLRLLASGQHDAMLLSKLVGMQALQKLQLGNVKALKTAAGFSQKFAFAVPKGQSELLAKLNEGLALAKSNGTYSQLYDQWFGVYEDRAIGLRDLLKYIIPIVLAFLSLGGYFFYRRQVERGQTQAAIAESRDLLMAVIDNAPVRVFWKDRNLRYLGCNASFARDAGVTHPKELIGKDDYQMAWAAQADHYRADDQAVMDTGMTKLFYEEPQTTPAGETIWLRTSKVPLRNKDGEAFGLLGVYEDITASKKAEEKLQLAASVFRHAREGIMITGADLAIIDVNDAFTDITGYRRDEVVGKNPRILNSGRQPKEFYSSMFRELIENGRWQGEIWNQGKNGKVLAMRQTISAVRDAQGKTQQYVSLFADITERKHAEAVFHGLFEQSIFLAGILDQQGQLVDINRTALNLTGSPRNELIGKYFPDTPWWTNDQDRAQLIEVLKIAYAGSPASFEATHPTPGGGRINVLFNAMPIFLEDGIQLAVVGVDITARKQLEDQVREMAFHDVLTQLPNRRMLNDRLKQTMAASKRSGRYGALMFIDLDNFKTLNDAHGHDVGDLLLLEVAARLKNCVREIDTVARFGGDEFVVMLSELNADQAESTSQAEIVAEKICVALAAPYLLSIQHEGKAPTTVLHHCTASIGVVVFINHEASQDDILKWADSAMYQAKEDGHNLVRFFHLEV